MSRLLYDVRSVAEVLSLPIRTVDRLIETEKIRSMVVGGRKLVHRGELMRFAAPAAPDVE